MSPARRSSRILTHERFKRTAIEDPHLRELTAVREITHALLNADRSEEVFQFALDRVSPLLGAAFASVYLVDDASELMRLTAAHQWPAKYRPWLSDVRVRVGFGPSGEAAAERRLIEVPDVAADPDLEDWAEVAKELGFKSLVALPLQSGKGVLGVVTFYFETPGNPTDERRSLMRTVADQLGVAAEKARLLQELRRTGAALSDANAELERQYGAVREARRAREEFLTNVSHELKTPLTSVLGYIGLLQEELSGPLTEGQHRDLHSANRAGRHLLRLIDDLIELSELKRLRVPVAVDEFDPGGPLQDALANVGTPTAGLTLLVEPLPELPPRLHSDRGKITRILISLLRNVFELVGEGEVVVGYDVGSDRIVYRVRAAGIDLTVEARRTVFEEFRDSVGPASQHVTGLGFALSRQLARLLGGDVAVTSDAATGTTFTAELPLEYDPAQSKA